MSDHADADHDGIVRSRPTDPHGTETVEAYEADDGVVLYDAENPMAWVQARETTSLEDAR